MKGKLTLIILFVTIQIIFAKVEDTVFIRGADISFTPQIEDLGGKYKQNGQVRDVLDIFKESGVNYIRLRLWHTPSNGYCGLEKTLQFAKRIKSKGFKFLLDFHYSDTWADPGSQTKPAAWQNLKFDNLKDSVYEYTKNVIQAFMNQNVLPDMVQTGNEITNGMLWPDGKLDGNNNWGSFTDLLKYAIKGVRDAAGTDSVKIMIHIDNGGNNQTSRWFFDNLLAQGVSFDIIGLSYYPWWNGALDLLQNNMNDLAVRYNKPIIVVETAYPWTTDPFDGNTNIVGSSSSLLPAFPATVKGQKNYLMTLIKDIKSTTNKKALGFFYWEPAYISVQPLGSVWENLTTFDFSGGALTSLNAFQNNDTMSFINATFRVNTATVGDTLKTNGFLQMRGMVNGQSQGVLPSGETLTQNANSEVIFNNTGGDYWTYTLSMYPNDTLLYKYWAGYGKYVSINSNSGLENDIIPYDNSNIKTRLFIAGQNDTVLATEYFNASFQARPQFWSPFIHKQDSIGVLFRVNISNLINKGLFVSDNINRIGVRGDSQTSAGVLAWDKTNIVLQKEINAGDSSSFYSAVAYFPGNTVKAGTYINYKFYVENSTFGGWESGIGNRYFSFPNSDTTLFWAYFNNANPLSVNSNKTAPGEFCLYPNYPNPFNPETTIKYSLPQKSIVNIKVYDLLGRNVRTLVNEEVQAGVHFTVWNGKDSSEKPLSSGIYMIRLEAGNFSFTQKALLLK